MGSHHVPRVVGQTGSVEGELGAHTAGSFATTPWLLRGPPVTQASDHGNVLCAVQRGGRGKRHGNTSCHGNSSGREERRASLKRQEPLSEVMTCVVLLVIREALGWFYLTRKEAAMPLTRLQGRERWGDGRLVAMAECTRVYAEQRKKK